MPVREAALSQLRRHEDRRGGISEEFLQPVLGGGRTVAVVSRPLGPARSLGWVICHAYGMEQVHLGRLDVIVARALSAQGYPVVRFHGQGYGDSEHGMHDVALSSHVADATDAVELIRSEAGVERVAIAGARLGGTVAALIADRGSLAALALWDPVISGAAYANELLRRRAISDMVRGADDEGKGHVAELRQQLEDDGVVELGGFPFTRSAYHELTSVDLTRDLHAFSGPSLLIGISRTERPGARLLALAEHLKELRGRADVDVIRDRFAPEFGRFHYRTDPATMGKKDTLYPISEAIADRMVRWAHQLEGSTAAPAVPGRAGVPVQGPA